MSFVVFMTAQFMCDIAISRRSTRNFSAGLTHLKVVIQIEQLILDMSTLPGESVPDPHLDEYAACKAQLRLLPSSAARGSQCSFADTLVLYTYSHMTKFIGKHSRRKLMSFHCQHAGCIQKAHGSPFRIEIQLCNSFSVSSVI